ncbi:MAG: hypothetical protein H0W88_05900 [Parachlamydiaceae bacterium]|nr:hypothetical protein [Parachlamydiaceae bacterium]
MASIDRYLSSHIQKSYATTETRQKLSNQDLLIANLEKGILLADRIEPRINWKLRIVKEQGSKVESGSTPQLKVVFEKDNFQVFGRLKFIKTLNEAIVYDRMQATKDPLCAYVPKYLGVLDSKGKMIDLRKEIEELGEKAVLEKYKPGYIILGDLLKEFETGPTIRGNVQDFKFAKPSLLGNDDEVQKHKQSIHNSAYKSFRNYFLGSSGCSFAHQGPIKGGWTMWIINSIRRFFSIRNTKSELRKNFENMEVPELTQNIRSLIKFKNAIRDSNFTSADSSLLFIPTTTTRNGRVRNNIEIRMIDFSHGMRKGEGIDGFDQMQEDMANSIQELIELMRESYLSKTNSTKRMYRNT